MSKSKPVTPLPITIDIKTAKKRKRTVRKVTTMLRKRNRYMQKLNKLETKLLAAVPGQALPVLSALSGRVRKSKVASTLYPA